jgi:hypothetical protein
MAILTVLTSFIMAILAKLFGDEIRAWLPTLSRRLKARAVRSLPKGSRTRYEEEWESDLLEIPGDLSKVFYSLGLQLAARQIRGLSLPALSSVAEASAKLVKEVTAAKFGLLPEPEGRSAGFVISVLVNLTILATVLLAGMTAKGVIAHPVMLQGVLPGHTSQVTITTPHSGTTK